MKIILRQFTNAYLFITSVINIFQTTATRAYVFVLILVF